MVAAPHSKASAQAKEEPNCMARVVNVTLYWPFIVFHFLSSRTPWSALRVRRLCLFGTIFTAALKKHDSALLFI